MNRALKTIALAAIFGSIVAVGNAQSTPPARKGTAESSLIGVSLYDSGLKLISKFGSPTEIQGLSIGAATAGAGGGGGPAGGGRGGPGLSGGTGQGPSAAGASGNVIGDPFDTGQTAWAQLGIAPGDEAPAAGTRGARLSGGSGGGEMAGRGGAGGGGGAGGTTQGSSGLVQFTRWVYNKGTSRYAFVLDKFNRVVQIEAFGLWDKGIHTRRSVRFGTTFGSLIKKYGAPDGYELNGDTMVVRYLNRDRVAFRLQRTDPKKGHVVTGIVVAAGK